MRRNDTGRSDAARHGRALISTDFLAYDAGVVALCRDLVGG
jgi:hypothetical protein